MSEEQIQHVLDSYLAAANDADANAMMALYADDVRVMDAYDTWMVEGKPSMREKIESWLGELKPGGWSKADKVRIDVSGELATLSALVLYAGELKDGSTAKMWNRYSAVLRQIDGEWKIVTEHTSLPLDMETDKPITALP